MKTNQFLALIVAGSMLAACQQGGPGAFNGGTGFNKQDIGTLGGAIGGGIIGSNVGGGKGKIAGTIGGALIGAFVGSELGKSLDNADRTAMGQTSQRALETAQPGQALPWKNAQSGNSGSVVAGNYYQEGGRYCREYTQTINVGGKSEKAYGTACRQPDGSWEVIK